MKNRFLDKQYSGRIFLIGATVLIWTLILILFKVYGYQETWELWKVPTGRPVFLDFRLIPGSAESFQKGFEPTRANPFDPGKRIFNYPAFWRLFFYTGISQADTVWISILMILLFFLSVLLFPKDLSIFGAIAMLLVAFSPASMLLYERGNVDLIVFVLCVMIVLAGGISAGLTALLVVSAAVIKMYPFLGISVLLNQPKNRFWLFFTGCFTFLLVYMAVTWDSVKASWTLTMRGDGISYGTNVFVTRYGDTISKSFSKWFSSTQVEWLLKYGSLAAGLFLLMVVAVIALRNREPLGTETERHCAAFRMGASIYVGTFLLGNNWDYRLAFLVLVVPQLVEWMRSTNTVYRVLSWSSMFLVLVSCWHFWIAEIPLELVFHSAADSLKFWIILDEGFNWMLFASFAYLLIASAPDWFRDQFGRLLPRRMSAISAGS